MVLSTTVELMMVAMVAVALNAATVVVESVIVVVAV